MPGRRLTDEGGSPANAPAHLARSLQPATGPAPQRILVVDDNADAAAMTRAMLELDGHEVAVATSGDAALASAPDFRPGVVFLDIGMPGMDGYAVADRLRADPRTAQAVLVAMTGYGREEDVKRARSAGFDHHLLKPVARSTLVSLLASLPVRVVAN